MVIECVMYFCGGFLIAVLLGLALFPAIHYRAVRLTHRSLDKSAPASVLEMRAEIDCLRAQFATSMCRLEKTVEQLKFTSAIRLSEIEQKTRTINRLKAKLARNTAVTDKLARPIEGLVLGTLPSIDEHANELAWSRPARRVTPVQSAHSAARQVIGRPVLETTAPTRKFTRFALPTAGGALDKPVLPLAMVSLAVAGDLDDRHREIEPPPRTIERHHRIGVKNESLEKSVRPVTDLKKSLLERGQHLNECDVEINALVHELAALNTSGGLQP